MRNTTDEVHVPSCGDGVSLTMDVPSIIIPIPATTTQGREERKMLHKTVEESH